MHLHISAPKTFSFKRTAISHGWYELPPFALDAQTWTLSRVISLADDKAITVSVTGNRSGLTIKLPRKLSQRAAQKVERDVRHIFRLDDDMAAFYKLAAQDQDFDWIPKEGAGRLLRAPTVFEDLVKTICTTNCSWSLTRKMVDGLVNALGVAAADGRRAFPTPAVMAAEPVSFYSDTVRAGYRAPYLKELAERVAAGELNVESWLASERSTDDLKRAMKGVKGVGDYAAENVLKLVGRYEGLALDSWLRAQFATRHNKGRAADDKKIARFYTRFGQWRGLAMWCDMTKGWLDGDEKLW